MKLHVLDVGHGDSILLEFDDGKSFGIVDCNVDQRLVLAQGQPKTLAFFLKLLDRGVTPTIEFACLTHPHFDHYSGFAELLEQLIEAGVRIKEYRDFGASIAKSDAMKSMAVFPAQELAAEQLVALCRVTSVLTDRHDCTYRMLLSPQENFWSGHGVSIDVFAPASLHAERYLNFLRQSSMEGRRQFLRRFPHAGDDNIICSGLRVRCGNFNLILGSDITNDGWRQIFRAAFTGSKFVCNALKVSHHGSVQGNFPEVDKSIVEFFTNRDCGIALISGGYRPNLPHDKVVTAFRDRQIQVFCTGKITGHPAVPYRPVEVAEDPDVCAILEADEVYELNDSPEKGYGDILLHFTPDGHPEVKQGCEK